jgi:ABC-type uncharacterized transport system ATPase subunit
LVLYRGEIVIEGPVEEILGSDKLREIYLGAGRVT